jgi:hypothetical protein
MVFKQVDLTTALRPSLLPNETLLFVQDGVGLYEGYEIRRWTLQPGLTIAPGNSRFQIVSKAQSISHLYVYATLMRRSLVKILFH